MAFGIAGMQAAIVSAGSVRRSQPRAYGSTTVEDQPRHAIRDAFAGTSSPTGSTMANNWQDLPNGQYSAMNVNIADMPFAVCSGAGGTVFFKDEQLAKTYAAREVNSGRELSMTVCKFTPFVRIEPKSLAVDITPLDANGKPALGSGE